VHEAELREIEEPAMRHSCFLSIAVLLALITHGPAISAAVLSVDPSYQLRVVGELALVDLTVTGLSDSMAPSLAGFDLTIQYDPSVVTFTDAIFGVALGDPALFLALTQVEIPAPDQVRLLETSLVEPTVLDDTQPDAFTLATLIFTAASPGISPIDYMLVDLVDANAQPLAATANNGVIEVIVPEPAGLTLAGSGFLLLMLSAWLARVRVERTR
jgi:hypothetical protein